MNKQLIWTEEELPQGSDLWLDFREARGQFAPDEHHYTLGGSEIAPLMYASPYKSMEGLWEDKLGLRPKADFTETMARGNKFESTARDMYAEHFGVEVEQLCAIHPKYSWMRTSLDGITKDRKVVLEIKTPRNFANHEKQTKNGKVIPYRYPQLQWQLAVMMAHFPQCERVDYISFFIDDLDEEGNEIDDPTIDLRIIRVEPRPKYMEELIRRGEIFLTYLDKKIRPPYNLFREDEPLIAYRNIPTTETN